METSPFSASTSDRAAYAALDILWEAGYPAFLVGGCVRDACMGRVPADYDITTAAPPETVTALFHAHAYTVIPTGIRHGTVTVRSPAGGAPPFSFEITTFRADGAYSDGRHPDSVRFVPDPQEDLARRDFTVNAMAWSRQSGLLDPFGGLADLRAGLLRCVGDPKQRFCEDALRILRALRFAAVLDFTVEPQTDAALRASRALLARVAPERVRTELTKLLEGPGCGDILRAYPDVLAVWIPEILPCAAGDVWQHTCREVERAVGEPPLRLCLLLCEIAKPDCGAQGYAEASAEAAGRILRRLRFDNATVSTVCAVIRAQEDFTNLIDLVDPTETQIKRLLNHHGEQRLRLLLALRHADRAVVVLDRVLAQHQCFSLRDLALNGHDLIRMGIQEGPAIRRILLDLLDAVISGQVPNDARALADRVWKYF